MNLDNYILGGAQLGFKYGILNNSSTLTHQEIEKLLSLAFKYGIKYIDTAPAYGDSEKILNNKNYNHFSIISKTDFRNYAENNEDFVLESLQSTLDRTSRNNIYGYLIHNTNEFLGLKNRKKIWKRLLDCKHNGLITKLGFSVYIESEIDKILDEFDSIDIIQLPINIFDQRLINCKILKKASHSNIELHARSIFLQGLLLCNINMIPRKLINIIDMRKEVDNYASKLGISSLDLSLAYIKNLDFISHTVVGVKSSEQLELLNAANVNSELIKNIDYSRFKLNSYSELDPRNW